MAGKTAALGEGLLEVPLRPAGERDFGLGIYFRPCFQRWVQRTLCIFFTFRNIPSVFPLGRKPRHLPI